MENTTIDYGYQTLQDRYALDSSSMPTDIEDLDFSVRTYNAFRRAGIKTVEALIVMTPEDLKLVRNFGFKCAAEVDEVLCRYGQATFAVQDDPLEKLVSRPLRSARLREKKMASPVPVQLYEDPVPIKPMEVASGYYLNVYDSPGKRDVFIIFNEANTSPSVEELDTLHQLIQEELKQHPSGQTLRDAIENSGLECVDFGVRVLSFGLPRIRTLQEQIEAASARGAGPSNIGRESSSADRER